MKAYFATALLATLAIAESPEAPQIFTLNFETGRYEMSIGSLPTVSVTDVDD